MRPTCLLGKLRVDRQLTILLHFPIGGDQCVSTRRRLRPALSFWRSFLCWRTACLPFRDRRRQEVRFAAVPGEKGGQDMFGAYDIVPNWPKPISSLPGHDKWTWGAGQGVFAESPNRVFILQRGELPKHHAADDHQAAPARARHRIPQFPAAVARRDDRQPPRRARNARRQSGRRFGRRQAGRRLPLGALHRRRRCQRQHHRRLDAVGQDVAAAARGLHQPLRSGEARLDRRRLPARHLHVQQRREEAAADDRRRPTSLAPTTSTSTGRRSWRGCRTGRSSSPTGTPTRAS